jgi:hypothetical protein
MTDQEIAKLLSNHDIDGKKGKKLINKLVSSVMLSPIDKLPKLVADARKSLEEYTITANLLPKK